MTHAQMKELAKTKIKGNILTLFLAYLVISLLTSLATAVVVGPFIVTPCFTLALAAMYIKLVKGEEIEIGDIFDKFSDWWIAFKVTFLNALLVALWSLLLIIPGIIKAYAYSQAIYIVAENPEITAKEALKRSEEMMDGHKMELFKLMLSFIGWILLSVLTCGLLFIWVLPYMNTTMILFYNSIKPVPAAQ